MHYFFLDESYREEATLRQITVVCWGVEQERLNRRRDLRTEIFKRPIEDQICSAIKRLDAIAVVCNATLEKSLFRSGEVDGTDDIPAMARADNIWSMSIIFAIGNLLLEHLHRRRPIETVDVYFDPKSLKCEHAKALEKALRELVVSEAKRFDRQLGRNLLNKLKIRRIQSVLKAKGGQAPTKFQIGTWVADVLCSRADRMVGQADGRIKIFDMSHVIKRTIEQWDGKSFYDE